ncbi:MAG: hypothetical protein GX638_03165, partial [Crenarchaeota archaeon]|nr:hypothetical protein [Thermoproteota archaeon]
MTVRLPKLLGYTPLMTVIGSNPELCQEIEKTDVAFQYREDCRECKHNDPDQCAFQSLMIGDFDLVGLSYDKLKALQTNSETYAAKNILGKLQAADVIILDEFSAATTPQIKPVTLATKDKEGNTHLLFDDLVKLFPNPSLWSFTLLYFVKKFSAYKSGVYPNDAVAELDPGEGAEKRAFSLGWNAIIKMTKAKGSSITRPLQDAFLAMFARKVVITSQEGNTILTPVVEDALWYLKQFVSTLKSDRRIFVIDAYEPTVNFQSLFGNVDTQLWGPKGDPLGTNAKQLIICDTATWNSQNFTRDRKLQEKYRLIIQRIAVLFSPDRIMIVSTSSDMTKIVNTWNLPKGIKNTYFRSEEMRGVPVEGKDIVILLNGPFIPLHAYDATAKSLNIENYITESDGLIFEEERDVFLPRLLWLDSIRGEFINTIGRVKDPNGQKRSLVFCLGMQKG